jgi:hypothetical protein
MRTLIAIVSALWMSGGLAPATGLAWNDTGHQVIASIAWDHLSETARQHVTELMARSTNASLTSLFPQDGRPLAVRQRAFFLSASTWPDEIRGTPDDHPTWHHRNLYWKQQKGQPVDLPDLEVNPQNILERLPFIVGFLADAGKPVEERAALVAWLVHLIGDVHQPLHVSARVTAREPKGDHGGNDFKLDLRPEPNPNHERNSLHFYWDGMLDKAIPRNPQEGFSRYVRRVADQVKAAHPRPTMVADLKRGKFEDWARESLAAAQQAYPTTLRRNEAPSGKYRAAGGLVAQSRVALGGYRLAATLEELFGQ